MKISFNNTYRNNYARGFKPNYTKVQNFGSTLKGSVISDTYGISNPDSNNKKVVTNSTILFRDSNSMVKLVEGMIKKYPDGAKIYVHACSDGSEAYSIAMLLIDRLGDKESKKFFPIIARDISKDMIKKAKSGTIEIVFQDSFVANDVLKNNKFSDFIKSKSKYNNITGEMKVDKRLGKCIKFEEANIVRDLEDKKIGSKEKPVVLMFQNACYYLDYEVKPRFFEMISNNANIKSQSVIYLATPEQSVKPFNYKVDSKDFYKLNADLKRISAEEYENEESFIYEKK